MRISFKSLKEVVPTVMHLTRCLEIWVRATDKSPKVEFACRKVLRRVENKKGVWEEWKT